MSSNERVTFSQIDAYHLNVLKEQFNAGCANFWFSHVPKAKVDDFIRNFNNKLGTGAIVFMADNMYVPGIGGEFVSKPGEEDTYKIRQLSNGEKSEVIKNYYNENQLKSISVNYADDLHINIGKCFWWLWYMVK